LDRFDFIFKVEPDSGDRYGIASAEGWGDLPVCPKCGQVAFEVDVTEEVEVWVCKICGCEWFGEVLSEAEYQDVCEKLSAGMTLEDLGFH